MNKLWLIIARELKTFELLGWGSTGKAGKFYRERYIIHHMKWEILNAGFV